MPSMVSDGMTYEVQQRNQSVTYSNRWQTTHELRASMHHVCAPTAGCGKHKATRIIGKLPLTTDLLGMFGRTPLHTVCQSSHSGSMHEISTLKAHSSNLKNILSGHFFIPFQPCCTLQSSNGLTMEEDRQRVLYRVTRYCVDRHVYSTRWLAKGERLQLR